MQINLYLTIGFIADSDCKSNCDIGWCSGYGFLIILMIFFYGRIFLTKLRQFHGVALYNAVWIPFLRPIAKIFELKLIQIGAISLMSVGWLVYLLLSPGKDPNWYRSFLGLAVVLAIGFVCSKHRSKINWRPVIVGVFVQFLIGILTIRFEVGNQIIRWGLRDKRRNSGIMFRFSCAAGKVNTFLDYSKDGIIYVYGSSLSDMTIFAFAFLTIIFFFNSTVAVLDFYGIIQSVVLNVGRVIQFVLGTTVCESVTAVANIFLGCIESAILIRQYLSVSKKNYC